MQRATVNDGLCRSSTCMVCILPPEVVSELFDHGYHTRVTATRPNPAQLIATLYDDPQECARVAELRYVSPEEPGLTRVRRGRGFTYRDAGGATVHDASDPEPHRRNWPSRRRGRNVWICRFEDGHILAVGEDDRERRQYIYHERWRALRDQLNFYRLIGFGEALPTIRADIENQLRRRTLDCERVLAAMLRIIDIAGLRVGNEVYAEENDSYGLSTLTRRHVTVRGDAMEFRFPAKSGRVAEVTVRDAGAARVVAKLAEQRSPRLFTVDGSPDRLRRHQRPPRRADRRASHREGLPNLDRHQDRVPPPAAAS